jgi:signal transduction histidine kinase
LFQGQGDLEFQPPEILLYFEELKRESNTEIGTKNIFEIGSKLERSTVLEKFKPKFWDHLEFLEDPHRQSYGLRRKWKLMVTLTLIVALVPFLSLSLVSYQSIRVAAQSEAMDQTRRLLENLQQVIIYLLSEDQEAMDMQNGRDSVQKKAGSRKMSQLLSKIASGKGESIFIADTNDLLKNPASYCESIQQKIILSLPENDNESQVFQIENDTGQPLIVGRIKIPKTSLLLVIIQNEETLLAGWRAPWIKLAGFYGIGILVILVMVLATATYVINRIHVADEQRIMDLHKIEYHNKMTSLGRLSAGIAHEINNSLSIINEKIGLIKDLLVYRPDDLPMAKLVTLLGDVAAPIRRCGNITHRLLNFGGHTRTYFEPVDLIQILYDIIDLLKKEAEFRHIDIHTKFPDKFPAITSNKGNLEQIFLNVMNNALTAMQSGGSLDIEVSNTHPDHVIILFEDTGCGIAQKDIQYVFEPFFSSKSTGAGTGLGLSVTYALAKELGGKISVASTEGKGTRFIIELPLEPPHKKDATTSTIPGAEV